MIKEIANKKIIIRAKYPLREDEEKKLAYLVKKFAVILQGMNGKQIMDKLPDKLKGIITDPNEMNLIISSLSDTKMELEDEEKENRIYTLYIFTSCPEAIIDKLIQGHAGAIKRELRFIESTQAIL